MAEARQVIKNFLFAMLALVLVIVLWVCGLWIVLQPDFGRWSTQAIVASHFIPPLVIWTLLLGGLLLWNRGRHVSVDGEVAVLGGSNQKWDAEITRRRKSCDCRAVLFAQLGVISEEPLVAMDTTNILVEQYLLEDTLEVDEEWQLIDWLKPALTESLVNIYSLSSAAAYFPIYVSIPQELAQNEVNSLVQQLHRDVTAELNIMANPTHSAALVLPLRDVAHITDVLISLVDDPAGSRGAVVLAMDSPRFRAATFGVTGHADEVGIPSEAIVTLLLTHSSVNAFASSVSDRDKTVVPSTAMESYRTSEFGLHLHVDLERRQLADLPVLGRIHMAADRAHIGTNSTGAPMIYRDLLKAAIANAGLVELPVGGILSSDVAIVEQNAQTDSEPPEIGWIVHNAGPGQRFGQRLSLLSNALHEVDVPLDPFDKGTNTSVSIGDLGAACSIGLLALSIVQTAVKQAPTLSAEFHGDTGVDFSVITPMLRASA